MGTPLSSVFRDEHVLSVPVHIPLGPALALGPRCGPAGRRGFATRHHRRSRIWPGVSSRATPAPGFRPATTSSCCLRQSAVLDVDGDLLLSLISDHQVAGPEHGGHGATAPSRRQRPGSTTGGSTGSQRAFPVSTTGGAAGSTPDLRPPRPGSAHRSHDPAGIDDVDRTRAHGHRGNEDHGVVVESGSAGRIRTTSTGRNTSMMANRLVQHAAETDRGDVRARRR